MGEDGYGSKYIVADGALQDRCNALVEKRRGAGGRENPRASYVVQVQRYVVANRRAWAKRNIKEVSNYQENELAAHHRARLTGEQLSLDYAKVRSGRRLGGADVGFRPS